MSKNESYALQRRTLYTRFCQHTEGVSLFAQAWWLDVVCGEEGWDVVFDVDKTERINAAMAFPVVKKWGFNRIKIPTLSAYTGIWIRVQTGVKEHQKQSFERNTFQVLTIQLPKTVHAYLYLPPYCQNWQPFYAAGWQIEPLLTHILDLSVGEAQLFANFKDNTQKKIRKSQSLISVSESRDVALIYGIYERLLASKGRKMTYSLAFLEKLDTEIQKNKAGKLYIATDTEGGVHAALYIVWDAETAYYWLGGAELAQRNSGALTFLLGEIFKDLIAKGIKQFDFTGSVQTGLEVFFSSFGAEKQTYFKVSKYRNRVFKFLHQFA